MKDAREGRISAIVIPNPLPFTEASATGDELNHLGISVVVLTDSEIDVYR